MIDRRWNVVAVGAIATAMAVGIGYPAGSGLATGGVGLLRDLLVVCAVALVAAGAVYAASGYGVQTTGHVLAGIGLGIAAAFGDGAGVWIGVSVAGAGGMLLVRDALHQGRRHRPSA